MNRAPQVSTVRSTGERHLMGLATLGTSAGRGAPPQDQWTLPVAQGTSAQLVVGMKQGALRGPISPTGSSLTVIPVQQELIAWLSVRFLKFNFFKKKL